MKRWPSPSTSACVTITATTLSTYTEARSQSPSASPQRLRRTKVALHHSPPPPSPLGLGVQWTQTPGEPDPPADTLQLCVGRRCLIFQLDLPVLLRRFLRNPSRTFVGFWNHSDRRKLETLDHELEMYRDPLDLRKYALTDEYASLAGASVEEIVEECLRFPGVGLRRDISMSHWDEEFLTDDQVLQACVDAHCAFLIGKNYKVWEFTR